MWGFQGDTRPGTGTAVITASKATQFAFQDEKVEGSPARSVFTKVLIEGLKTGTADRDGDGQVSVDELFDFLRENATTDSQVPELSLVGNTGEIIIARNPHPRALPAELPRETLDAIQSDIWWNRKGVVAVLAAYVQGEDRALALAARRARASGSRPDSRVSTTAAGALGAAREPERPPDDDESGDEATPAAPVLSLVRSWQLKNAAVTMHLEIDGRRVREPEER